MREAKMWVENVIIHLNFLCLVLVGDNDLFRVICKFEIKFKN